MCSFSQSAASLQNMNSYSRLLKISEDDAKLKENCRGDIYLFKGHFAYYHYLCDNFDDRGWGCGYRTLQSICSWINTNTSKRKEVPNIRDVQNILVKLEDKPLSFLKSRGWIGSFEVSLILDSLYDISCRILHVNSGSELQTLLTNIKEHFIIYGSPIMMGGDVDNSSKGIIGLCINKDEMYLLIMDPHYAGEGTSLSTLIQNGWIAWRNIKDFQSNSFYNLCLPLLKSNIA